MSLYDRLCDRLEDLQAKAQAIKDHAEAENREFTPDECDELDGLLSDIDEVRSHKDRVERLDEHTAQMSVSRGRQIDPDKAPPADVSIRPVESSFQRNRWGFDNFGEYLQSVRVASAKGGTVDNRLIANAPTTVGTEGTGADGGFAVPPDFRAGIVQLISGEDSLLARTDQQMSSSNTFTIPTDETTPWQTTGGILTYWVGEGNQMTQSKPSLSEVTLKLHKLTALVPVSEELLEDAVGMENYVRTKAAQKIAFEMNRVIVNGTGAGQPLGILNAPATVSVAKETNQTADTINFDNIIKMWSRCYGPSRSNAVWLINQDIEPQLMKLSFEGTSSSVPAYLPANGLSGSPYSTLMGRPIIPTQACETLGDKGDIILADLGQYLTVAKQMRAGMSVHLWWDYDVACFRFVLRVAGAPWWSSAASPRDGSNTLSPFVTLAERA